MITHTIDSYQIKSKQDKVKVTNFKKLPKLQIFKFCKNHFTRHTSWSCLIRCVNVKWIQLVFWKLQSRHDSVHKQTDRRTDRRTDDMKPVYPPFNFVEAGGIIRILHLLSVGVLAYNISWWCHHMETISTLLTLYEENLLSQRVSNVHFDVFFGVNLKQLLKKQSIC